MARVVTQHFFDGREFVGGLLLGFLMRKLLFLLGLARGKF
jgi:hypothetical protein